jgi:hypothetical protein
LDGLQFNPGNASELEDGDNVKTILEIVAIVFAGFVYGAAMLLGGIWYGAAWLFARAKI